MINGRRNQIVIIILGLGSFLWVFGDVMFNDKCFVFRDVAHFYFPSLRHIQSVWVTDLPAWNAMEQLGRPLAADPTSGVFYPGKLIFLLPISFARALVCLILIHFLLACVNAYVAARGIGCSVPASGLCSLSYAFGGYVLGQHCNLIYLISAAWFPLGLLLAWQFSNSPSLMRGVFLALVHALMILGGDPQAAYHLGLIQILLVFYLFRSPALQFKETFGRATIRFVGKLTLAMTPLLIGLGISAIQFIPSVEWSAASNRAQHDSQRTIYDVVKPMISVPSEEAPSPARLWAPAQAGTHKQKSYRFSIGPWRWLELLWPNALGKQYPQNQRWGNLIPAEGAVWTPTLYAGLLPIVLVLANWRRCDYVELRWLRCVIILAVIASLGWHGVGWLGNELGNVFGWNHRMWQPVGGLYWLMNLTLPCYAQFRYPAKIWLLVAIASSLLAARSFDTVFETRGHIVRRLFWIVLIASLLILMAFSLASPEVFSVFPAGHNDALFGPFDTHGAFRVCQMALLQTIAVSALVLGCCRFVKNRKLRRMVLILVAVLDLCMANAWTVTTAHSTRWDARSELAQAIKNHAAESEINWYRIYRPFGNSWYPKHWDEDGNQSRQVDCLIWDRETLYPRYGLLESLASIQVSASFSTAEFDELMNIARRTPIPSNDLLDALGVTYVIGPEKPIRKRRDLQIIHSKILFGETICVAFNADALPFAWAVNDSIPGPTQPPDRLVNQLFGAGSFNVEQLRQSAISEIELPPSGNGKKKSSANVQLIDAKSANEIRFRIHLSDNALVVVNQQYVPGWQCTAIDTPNERVFRPKVVRVNGIMSGVQLPAGKLDVTLDYAPRSIRMGCFVSAITIGACIFMVVLVKLRR